MQPSSPYRPCRALNTTSGPPPPAGRRKSTSARRSRLTSYSITVVAAFAQPLGAGLAAHQRDLALGRPAAHQDRDACSSLALSRQIARCAGFPIPAARRSPRSTRRRTSSPSASMSAAVASPVIDQELLCFSETCAPPSVRPRQPARSISSQALRPGGLAKVEPPVRLRGWVSARAPSISAMRARDRELVARRWRASRAEVKIQSAGALLWR